MDLPNNSIDEVIKNRTAMFKLGRLYRDSALSVAEEVSIPDFREILNRQGIRSTHFLLHSAAQASLQIPQLRLRIKKQENGQEEMVAVSAADLYCSYVVQNPYTDINHCSVPFDHSLVDFAARAQQQEPFAQQAKEVILSAPDPEGIKAINVSIIPWLRLNSLVHGSGAPIPMFTIGKFCPVGDRITFTFCILVDHRLVDAVHIHQFLEQFCLNVSSYVANS